jgi:hypothetical protein
LWPISLVLTQGINPAWQQAIQQFRQQSLDENVTELTLEQWTQLKASFAAYKAWLAKKPDLAVSALAADKRQALLNSLIEQALLVLVDDDLKVADAANALVDLDKLVRYQAGLVTLLITLCRLVIFIPVKIKLFFRQGRCF